jgi:hypothetical protein
MGLAQVATHISVPGDAHYKANYASLSTIMVNGRQPLVLQLE